MKRALRNFPIPVKGGKRDWGPETGQGLSKVTFKSATLLGVIPRDLSPSLALPLASYPFPLPRAKRELSCLVGLALACVRPSMASD